MLLLRPSSPKFPDDEVTFGKITKYQDDGREHPFVVYMVLNKINGNFYIGATQKGARHRSMIHLTTARSDRNGNQSIYRAIRKHGEKNFKFLTLKECADYWDALESERSYIAAFKPRYNMTDGGGGVKGLKHSDKSKNQMSLAKKGKPSVWTKTKMPQEIRDKLAAVRRAETGTPWTEERKAACRANALIANVVRRKPVICLNTGIEYESNTAAGRAHSLTAGQITRLCKLGGATRKGLRFARKEKT